MEKTRGALRCDCCCCGWFCCGISWFWFNTRAIKIKHFFPFVRSAILYVDLSSVWCGGCLGFNIDLTRNWNWCDAFQRKNKQKMYSVCTFIMSVFDSLCTDYTCCIFRSPYLPSFSLSPSSSFSPPSRFLSRCRSMGTSVFVVTSLDIQNRTNTHTPPRNEAVFTHKLWRQIDLQSFQLLFYRLLFSLHFLFLFRDYVTLGALDVCKPKDKSEKQ